MATIKDVAKKAGLSVSTVSRYLNNHPYISDDKRDAIKKAMDELNYSPSSVATQLRTKKGNTIGILVSRITNPYFSYLVDSIERTAKSKGYNVLIMQTYDDKTSELHMLEMLKQKFVSAIIMCSMEGSIETIENYKKFGPIVLCNEEFPESDLLQVSTDQEAGSYEATKYLIDQGYSKIAYCTGGDLTTNGHGSNRAQGFERALSENNLTVKKNWIFPKTHSIADGREVACKILEQDENKRPTAIFTSSDEVATGILSEYLSRGLKVPEDLAIMGFDNQPSTEILAVPLTTIQQPVKTLGQEVTNLIIAKLEGQTYEVDYKNLKLELIKRKSA